MLGRSGGWDLDMLLSRRSDAGRLRWRAGHKGPGPRRGGQGEARLAEAFAIQSLVCVDDWKIDPEIVNGRGGAISLGHPLSASGGRILGTLAKVLRADNQRWRVAAICIGVGQGLAVVLENQDAS